MSGLEIVAAVAGIIGAFNGSVKMYVDWRDRRDRKDKRRERRKNAQNKNLEKSLVLGSSTVQKEYENQYARLGPKFAVGDDRGRAEMAGYIIKLQHSMIAMLTDSSRSSSVILPNFPLIFGTSEDTRKGVVTALLEQYQRMAQAQPLLPAVDPPQSMAQAQPVLPALAPPQQPIIIVKCLKASQMSKSRLSPDMVIPLEPMSCECGFASVGDPMGYREVITLDGLPRKVLIHDLYCYHPRSVDGRLLPGGAIYCQICLDKHDREGLATGNEKVLYPTDTILSHLSTHTWLEFGNWYRILNPALNLVSGLEGHWGNWATNNGESA